MKTWSVVGKVEGGAYLGEVEAETEAEAIAKGEAIEFSTSLCHQCSKDISDLEVTEISVDEVS